MAEETIANDFEELADACEARSETYALLSRFFRTEVDEEFLQALCATLYPAKSGNEKIDAGHYAIAKYLSNEWVDPLRKLGVDYTRAFLGDGMDTYSCAYPYESVYTSPKRLLMQEARDEVLAIYRSCGLDKQTEWNVGEDHIAVELEFMRVLCLRSAVALRSEDEKEAQRLIATMANFLDEHLLAWAPMFTADVRRFCKTQFYQGVAQLTEGFLEADREFLADVLGPNAEGDAQ